jgi:hypothetical protein
MAKIEVELSNGAKAGQTLQELSKEAGKLNKEISKLPIGSQEFVEKSKKLQEVNGSLTEVRNQIKGTTTASNELKNTWSQFIPFSGQFQAIGQQIGGTTKGVGGLVSSFTTLRGAIISTGIGALIVLLGTLISYFTTTQEGMDKVTSVTRPLTAIMERLKGVLQELGQKVFKQIAEAIENPKQALVDLGNIIKDNIIKRFEALALFGPALKKILSGDLAGGFKDLGNASIQAVTGVENAIDKLADVGRELGNIIDEAYEKGQRLDELQKQIERGEINQIKRSKELELIIKQQKDIVEDSTRSFDERRAAAERALQAQQTLLTTELSLLDKRIEKMKLEQTLNDTDRAAQKELAELEAKRFEVQAKVTEQSIEFKKKIQEFDAAQAAQQEATIKNIEDLQLQTMREGMEKEIAEIELQTERKIEALTGSAEQILEQERLLEEIRQMEIQAVRDRYAQEQAEKDKKAKDEQAKRDKELADEQKRIAEEKAEFEQAMADITTDIASDSFAFATELSARSLKDQETAKKVRKAGGLIEVGINAQKELSANAVKGADIAASIPGPAGVAAGTAYVAGANLRTLIRSGIMAAKIIAFRRGGVLRGPSHEDGGIDFTINGRPGFNAEGDEILLTRGVYRNPVLRHAASVINVLGGGRKFAAGGPLNPFNSSASSSATSARATSAAADQSIFGMDQLNSLLRENLQAINSRIDNLKVINVATETEDVLSNVNRIRNEADV